MISAISKEGAVVRPPLLRGQGFLRVQLFITGENAAFAEALGKQQVLAAQGAELLRGRVADMDLVQVAGTLAVEAYDLSRYAHSCRVGGHLVKHNGPGGNTGVVSDPEGAEPMSTLSPRVGWRLPWSLPVPPRVTPWYSVQLSPISAVSPITTPIPWSMNSPLPMVAPG